MSAITIKRNGSDAPEFISVKVPVYKSYTSQSVSLSYGYSPDDSMYESIVWSSDSSLVSVDENGTVSPAAKSPKKSARNSVTPSSPISGCPTG